MYCKSLQYNTIEFIGNMPALVLRSLKLYKNVELSHRKVPVDQEPIVKREILCYIILCYIINV